MTKANGETYIRVNQVGYLPDDTKIAVIMSTEPLTNDSFKVGTEYMNSFSGKLSDDQGEYLAFPHHYYADFSDMTDNGTYVLNYSYTRSVPFRIGTDMYNPMADSLLRFFRVQRCGLTDPLYHYPCHLSDASNIVGGPDDGMPVEATGGWHDAADYIKFLITTSHAAYMLLLTYEMYPDLIPDRDGNGRSDLLDEAKVGIDWMMKMHYAPDRLLTQVQDLSDHDVGWRLPDEDLLDMQRPAYYMPSKAYCGSFVAAMALASKLFQEPYAGECLRHAREVYAISKTDIPEYAVGPDSMYYDKIAWDNLALAAVELYRATGEQPFLSEAVELTEDNGQIYWFSWGDVDGLAYARLAAYHPPCRVKLENILANFAATADSIVFGYPLKTYPWGSASIQTGVATLAILHHKVTGSAEYLPLARKQRDFLLGMNSHGMSFISRFGSNYPLYLHSQVSHMTSIPLPAALAGGYVSYETFRQSGIVLEYPDRMARFQNDEAIYHDDRADWLCNEPTIANNAQALFLFAFYCR